jgi:hypothetical protein
VTTEISGIQNASTHFDPMRKSRNTQKLNTTIHHEHTQRSYRATLGKRN